MKGEISQQQAGAKSIQVSGDLPNITKWKDFSSEKSMLAGSNGCSVLVKNYPRRMLTLNQ